MKFGIVIHKSTMNLGDDIQTYAAAKLLPHVDYQIDREYVSDFESKDNEPVAVIMNAWWMWKSMVQLDAGIWTQSVRAWLRQILHAKII